MTRIKSITIYHTEDKVQVFHRSDFPNLSGGITAIGYQVIKDETHTIIIHPAQVKRIEIIYE